MKFTSVNFFVLFRRVKDQGNEGAHDDDSATEPTYQEAIEDVERMRADCYRLVSLLLDLPLQLNDSPKPSHGYLRSLCANQQLGCVRVYGEQVYIFVRGNEENTFALITVLHLPRAIRAAGQRQ